MITEKHANAINTVTSPPRQLKQFLPWLIGAAGLALYLITLNRWISFNSLPSIAGGSGWTWEPRLSAPLTWVVTFPFRWLPPMAIPLAYNVFSAICGALVLALLARSVMLLPHDRTHPQRLREKSEYSLLTIREAWVAPVLAAMVCGLQLTFWELATAGSAEMIDLLVFAYIIRCLLEFRIQERQSWLTRAAFVYGLGMTNNWAMIGFFPLFLAAVVWIKGFSFFNLRFLGQMALCGLAGLSLYLLLPLVQSFQNHIPIPFWQGLKVNLGTQKTTLGQLYTHGKPILMLLSLTSLIPVFLIAIRWASYFGDTSPFGVTMATIMFHIVHGVLLVACIWVALDPPFSPRNKGFGYPFLTFYYLGALSVGYFAGYFLLLFSSKFDRARRIHPLMRLLNRTVVAAVWILLVATTAALAWFNWPRIRVMNSSATRNYVRLLAQQLPKEPTILLSDDARPLLLLQALTTENRTSKNYLFVDTRALKWPPYHKFLRSRYGERWPFVPPKGSTRALDELSMFRMVGVIGQTNQLFYLHPTFGYYLEQFYLEPHGLAFKLNSFGPNTLMPPAPKSEIVTQNEAFWHDARESFEPLFDLDGSAAKPVTPGLIDRLRLAAHLTKKPARDTAAIAGFYSRSLDYWGVEMQKQGELAKAEAHFQTALQLNPENVVAQVNLDCNRQLQVGAQSSVKLSKSVEEAFGKYRNWEQIMGENGPFDEPNFCFEQGRVYFRSKLYRQAAQQFARVKQLAPDHLPARLWLGEIYVLSNLPDDALRMVGEIHSRSEKSNFPRTNLTELLAVETSAYLAKNEDQQAESAVQRLLDKHPNDEDLLLAATQIFLSYGRYSNALTRIDQQLKMTPDNPYLLVNKGYAHLQLRNYAQALPPLTKALTLETNNHSALLNRAIANLGATNLDEAQHDYESLQKAYPTAFQIYYGLGEIAYLRQDTNAAIRYYQLYLTNSPPGNQEAEFVSDRLKKLAPDRK